MVDFSLQAAHAGIPGWWQGCNLLITLRTLHNAHRWSQHAGHFLQFFYHCHHHVEVSSLCNTTTQWCFLDFLKPLGHFWCSWYWLQFNMNLFFKTPPSLGLNCPHCVQLDWSLLTCNVCPHKDFNATSLFILWPGSWPSLACGTWITEHGFYPFLFNYAWNIRQNLVQSFQSTLVWRNWY